MQLIPRHDPYLVVRSTGGTTIAALRGELDLVLVRHLRPELDALVRESEELTLDIRGLAFCDATGLGLLAHCAGGVRRRGARWRLVCDQPSILRLIRLAALGELLCPQPALPREWSNALGEAWPEPPSGGLAAGVVPVRRVPAEPRPTGSGGVRPLR
ncbi:MULTISPECIES: STAS domain-containing protein [unclassified Streptomyces]|uniref:STAS domain-containing protein n=1 Tax=unclassified Streptomyces TaxID=2593676 RepID=UPI0016610FF5|nr:MULTISPECIES: STAS domain-containing protein [unclassified Streptomyces]MBD0708196.1 hypothetical protein [Streptomyces sp. CBMA291]MBD0714494.1 hypothetical protein [Streptomyces sp. CBMA370]